MGAPLAHHAGLTVADLEEALGFYRDTLGFHVVDRFTVSGEAFSAAVDVPEANAQFVHLDAGGVIVELISYDEPGASATEEGLDQPGATHLGFTIDDLDGFLEEVPERVPRLSDPQTTATGTYVVFLRDPDGNLVELLEPPDSP